MEQRKKIMEMQFSILGMKIFGLVKILKLLIN